jgi:hypothetical protein
MLPHFAREELWKKPGKQTWLISPRVAATRLEVPDEDGKGLGVHFVHGRTTQQGANDALRDECYGHLDEGLDFLGGP